jgi:hypothetical protein
MANPKIAATTATEMTARTAFGHVKPRLALILPAASVTAEQ